MDLTLRAKVADAAIGKAIQSRGRKFLPGSQATFLAILRTFAWRSVKSYGLSSFEVISFSRMCMYAISFLPYQEYQDYAGHIIDPKYTPALLNEDFTSASIALFRGLLRYVTFRLLLR